MFSNPPPACRFSFPARFVRNPLCAHLLPPQIKVYPSFQFFYEILGARNLVPVRPAAGPGQTPPHATANIRGAPGGRSAFDPGTPRPFAVTGNQSRLGFRAPSSKVAGRPAASAVIWQEPTSFGPPRHGPTKPAFGARRSAPARPDGARAIGANATDGSLKRRKPRRRPFVPPNSNSGGGDLCDRAGTISPRRDALLQGGEARTAPDPAKAGDGGADRPQPYRGSFDAGVPGRRAVPALLQRTGRFPFSLAHKAAAGGFPAP